MEAVAAGRIPGRELDALYDEAVRDTIEGRGVLKCASMNGLSCARHVECRRR